MLSQALPAASPAAAPDMPDAFIDATGSVDGEHALVLGAGGLETMCALLHRGCASAIELRLGEDDPRSKIALLQGAVPHTLADTRVWVRHHGDGNHDGKLIVDIAGSEAA